MVDLSIAMLNYQRVTPINYSYTYHKRSNSATYKATERELERGPNPVPIPIKMAHHSVGFLRRPSF